ncbi:T9SS type A sorting domain-containing protein [Flavihumibacter solisilvae]|uniref:Secretion system C-terminal sorting domain-containing protein n=1 Tax=Flavihumibacter solisilvae TaxID=1349421 RepID=A0A0C1I9M6_9BACT|nr:T9SS type A sorting domain-containing protein [Flavihumibacter solisilvae]KIC90715.1 hypothetical protein OI18_22715 [Flavihumibacter solisilvae]
MKGTSVLMLLILLCVNAWAQRTGDYRSNGTVRLNNAANWLVYNGSGWITTTTAPSSATLNNNNTITILANHTWSNTANVNMPSRNFIFLMQSNSTNFTVGTTINWNTQSTVIFENTAGTVSYAISNQTFNILEIRRSGGSGNYTASISGTNFIVNNTLTVGANTTLELSSITLSLPGNNKTTTLAGSLSLQSSTVNIPGNSPTLNTNGTVTMNNSTINFSGNSPTFNANNTVSLVSSALNFDRNNARFNQDGVLNLTNSIIDFKGSNAVMNQNADISFLNSPTSSSYIKFLAATGRINMDGTISGASPSNYIQLGSSSTAANIYSASESVLVFPVGTASNYLPVSVARSAPTFPTLTVSVFEGVTNNGQFGGTAFSNAQKVNLVDAVWRITSSTSFTPSAIDLGWQQPLEGAGFVSLTSNIGMSYYNTATVNWTTSSGSGNGLLNTVNRNSDLPAIGTTGMSFGVGIIGVVLPLQLTDFRAVTQQSAVMLSWTASGNGNSYFEVERASTLNGNYISIAQLNTDGNGEQKYRHTDLHPLKDGYYRIRTVYENHVSTYSAALKVQFGNGQLALEKVYPSISLGSLNLVISSPAGTSATIEISDLNGRTFSHEVKQLFKGSNQYLLNTGSLPIGNYVVQVKTGEKLLTGRFIRQ